MTGHLPGPVQTVYRAGFPDIDCWGEETETRFEAEEAAWDAYSRCGQTAEPEVLTFQTRRVTSWHDEART